MAESLSDAEWQRIAEAMAVADDRPTHEFRGYLQQAKMIMVAMDTLLQIMEEKLTKEKAARPD